jgi:hypothetical protein
LQSIALKTPKPQNPKTPHSYEFDNTIYNINLMLAKNMRARSSALNSSSFLNT